MDRLMGGTRRRTRAADGFLIATTVVWLAWVSSAPLWSGMAASLTGGYVTAPLVLLATIAVGRLLARYEEGWILPVVGTVAGAVVLLLPIYANAQAAVGVQVVAAAGLLFLSTRPGPGLLPGPGTLAGLAAMLVVGLMLAARSLAATVLVAVLLAVVVASLLRRHGGLPRRRTVAAAAAIVLSWAAVAVVWLGSLDRWPAWLGRSEWLSFARHELWQDARDLWAQHPVTGGGPGSFRVHSELAGSTPDLARAHSSVLQVGAELGLVGVLILTCWAVAVLAVASRGTLRAAIIAIVAWACLGVHSAIDHLFEFPIVPAAAGLVIGGASALPHRFRSRRTAARRERPVSASSGASDEPA